MKLCVKFSFVYIHQSTECNVVMLRPLLCDFVNSLDVVIVLDFVGWTYSLDE